MNLLPRSPLAGGTGAEAAAPAPGARGTVAPLDQRRIERALRSRRRYRYVQPRVLRMGEDGEGAGWQVLSPNCSRSVDPRGGEVPIAWLQPLRGSLWQLHARDHRQQCWRATRSDTLPALLAHLCADPDREYWQ